MTDGIIITDGESQEVPKPKQCVMQPILCHANSGRLQGGIQCRTDKVRNEKNCQSGVFITILVLNQKLFFYFLLP